MPRKKNFFGEFLEKEEEVEMDVDYGEQPEAVFIGSEEEDLAETHAAIEPREKLELEQEDIKPARGRRTRPAEKDSPFDPNDGVMYVQARRVAELKFEFFKWVALAVPVNLLLFSLAWFEVQPSGKYWFVWPVGLSLLFLLFQYARAFLFQGRSLHSVIENTIHSMAVRESRKRHLKDFGEY